METSDTKHSVVERQNSRLSEGDDVAPTTENGGTTYIDEKDVSGVYVSDKTDLDLPSYDHTDEDGFAIVNEPVSTAEDIVTQVLHVEDDPSLPVCTFRSVVLGIGLAIFASVLQEIFYFKPQVIYVSVVFLTVIGYALGEAMAILIPTKGIFRHLNPGPFNQKEHAAIAITASAAAVSATSTQALAAQDLFYGGYPSKAAGIFITFSTQLIGFGMAGLLREVLVYPTRMLWPMNLPVSTLLEVLHRDKKETKRRLKLFFGLLAIVFVWEALPEYMFTTLVGVSVFCLADQHNLVFTNLFGGASGNEGLGFLSLCFDWNYIAGLWNPLWMPWETSVNLTIGLVGCYILFMGAYYGNLWSGQNFPFLSQFLFDPSSNATNYVVWNQTAYINSNFEIETDLITRENAPYFTSTFVCYLITSSMGMTATFVHLLLWNFEDIKAGWAWARISNLKKLLQLSTYTFWKNQETPEQRFERLAGDPALDPHYKLMLRNRYRESPNWWWGIVFAISFIAGITCLYIMDSTLPWWGFIVAILLTMVFLLFFGAQMGMTGFQFNVQPICQMLAGYLFPGKPLANMYFTCYTYNALQQGQLLSRDLKLAQNAHLPPRMTFMFQIIGCVTGAIFNWIMMIEITANQASILRAIQGTNIWSGQNIQILNTTAIAWSIAPKMFNLGARYQWVPLSMFLGILVPFPFWLAHRYWRPYRIFSFLNLSIILWFMGNLVVGINSSTLSYTFIAIYAQFYLRRYKPSQFIKYNYLVSAALDGGTQILIFVLSFAVLGAAGKDVPFPTWAGNPDLSVTNADHCMLNPASA